MYDQNSEFAKNFMEIHKLLITNFKYVVVPVRSSRKVY